MTIFTALKYITNRAILYLGLAIAVIMSGNPPAIAHDHADDQYQLTGQTQIVTGNDKSGCLCCDDTDFATANGCSRCCAMDTGFSVISPPAPTFIPPGKHIFVQLAGLVTGIEPPPPRL